MSEVTADVPVSPVGDSSGRPRPKAPIVAVVVIAIAIAGAGIAGRLGTRASRDGDATSAPSASARPSSATESPRPSGGPPADATLVLPAIASRPLPGAPVLALWRRVGDDAAILAWDPADPQPRVAERLRVPGLLRGIGPDAAVLLARSPSGRFLATSALTTSPGADDRETVRIARTDGTIAWQANVHSRTLVAPAWNPVRDELVVPTPGRWSAVTLASSSGRSGGPPVDRPIAVPTYEREPVGSGGPNPLVPTIAAFSADGNTAYAAAVDSPFLLGLRPLFAVDLGRARARPIDRLPAELANTTTQAGPPELTRIDPLTGRVVGLAAPGSRSVRIYEPDGVHEAVRIERTRVLGATWGPDGLLALLSTGPGLGPDATELELLAADGNPARTPMMTTAVGTGGVIAGPDGYVLLVFGSEPPADVELVALRLSDGATAATTVSSADLAGVEFLGWLAAEPGESADAPGSASGG